MPTLYTYKLEPTNLYAGASTVYLYSGGCSVKKT